VPQEPMLSPMKPKYKLLVLLLTLSLPYFGFVMYFATQFPQSKPVPVWFTDTLMAWFTANFLIAVLLGKRIMKGQVVAAEKARVAAGTAANESLRLVMLWIVLFLCGGVATVKGKVPINRALPAGAFLLLFIGIFGWTAYRTGRANS